MKSRPILFSAPMVRALLDGSKTQTRRVVKPQPPANTHCVSTYHYPDPRDHFWAYVNKGENECEMSSWVHPCPYGQADDQLWVRETFDPIYPQDPTYNGGRPIEHDYRATYTHGDRLGDSLGIRKKWTPAIHMPRTASRISLEITGVRVERLQACNEVDAIAEGANWAACTYEHPSWTPYRLGYCKLWESINGPGSWDKNPWVWVVEFKAVKP